MPAPRVSGAVQDPKATMRILVVEAQDRTRELVVRWLTRSGHDVVGQARTPAEAVYLFSALAPDVCAVDVGPDCACGLEALRCIIERDPGARVIACTNAGFGVNTVAAVHAGAAHVVTSLRRLDTVLVAMNAESERTPCTLRAALR